MAPFYRLYQHGYSMESIQKELKNVLDMVAENNKVEGEIFTNFECAAAFLSVRLISYQKNKEFLSLVPHRRILDLAIIYQLVFEGTDTTMGAAVVYQDHCRIWEVTEDILFQTAIASMIRRFPPSLNSVEALIGLPELPVQSDFPHLFALTNSKAFFGASVIMYPGILRTAAKKLGGAYYILPSSMHEVLLLAKDKDTDPSQLKEIAQHNGFYISFRCNCIDIGNEITKVGIIFLTDWCFKGCWLSCDLHDLHNLFFRHVQRLRQL